MRDPGKQLTGFPNSEAEENGRVEASFDLDRQARDIAVLLMRFIISEILYAAK